MEGEAREVTGEPQMCAEFWNFRYKLTHEQVDVLLICHVVSDYKISEQNDKYI